MSGTPRNLRELVDRARAGKPVRVAVVNGAQRAVVETLREAHALGFAEPRLIGEPDATLALCESIRWQMDPDWMVPAHSPVAAARKAVELVRTGAADTLMKGQIHTDELMHALLDKERGLRVPGRRVSHVFLVEVPDHPRLLGITDAAINIAPDLQAKAEILQNAVDFFQLIGVARPKAAILSAVETVNPAIVSTLDAACLTLMARRGQIGGAVVDGPLAFDNAISSKAAHEKGIASEVAGAVDIVLVPDLVSGNILAKNLEYLAGAVAAGIVLGLAVPVVLSSRADEAPARLAGLAVAALMHRALPATKLRAVVRHGGVHCAPQPDAACRPIPL